jgi:hypothetical protein
LWRAYEVAVKFAEIRNHRAVKEHFRRGVGLVLLLNLGACLPDQSESLANCQKDADRFFMAYRNDDPENPRSRYIIECMATKGYDFTVEPTDCDSRRPFTTQPACFSPRGWLNWIEFELRRKP